MYRSLAEGGGEDELLAQLHARMAAESRCFRCNMPLEAASTGSVTDDTVDGVPSGSDGACGSSSSSSSSCSPAAADAAALLPALRRLSVGWGFGDATVRLIAEHSPCLTSLTAAVGANLTDDGLEAIAGHCEHLQISISRLFFLWWHVAALYLHVLVDGIATHVISTAGCLWGRFSVFFYCNIIWNL